MVSLAGEFAAIVDGATINFKEFDSIYMDSVKEYKKNLLIGDAESLAYSELENLKYTVLEALIDNKIFENYAKKYKIVISDKDVKQRIQGLEKGYAKKEDFWKAMRSQNIKQEQLFEGIRGQLLKEMVVLRAYPEMGVITTKDMLLYFRKNILGMYPIQYNLTIIVTDNVGYLNEVIAQGVSSANWDALQLDKEQSKFNISVMDEDLPITVADMIELLDMQKFSEVTMLEGNDYFSIKVNHIENMPSLNIVAITKSVRETLFEEKKSLYIKKWLDEQKEVVKLTFNYKVFPNYFRRENKKPSIIREMLMKIKSLGAIWRTI